tara:strand:- start:5152 stop:5556 length:405 start_codon:yes stop_codon:yes gene_type:complete
METCLHEQAITVFLERIEEQTSWGKVQVKELLLRSMFDSASHYMAGSMATSTERLTEVIKAEFVRQLEFGCLPNADDIAIAISQAARAALSDTETAAIKRIRKAAKPSVAVHENLDSGLAEDTDGGSNTTPEGE